MFIVPENLIAGLMTRALAFDAVEAVFASMSMRVAYNFPVIREAIGHEDALYGYKGGFDRAGKVLGVKEGGYWTHNMERRQEINHQSSICLFDPNTGKLHGIVGGNLLTALRTAAASAVSIKYLARQDAKILGMVGAGHQSVFQLRAALEQRDFEKVIGWNRSPEKLERLSKVASDAGLEFEAVAIEDMQKADAIITITSSFAPSLMANHVSAGTHIACMGTDTKGKQEVAAAVFGNSSVFADEITQSVTIGEAQHAITQGIVEATDITEIGQVINGKHPGRRSDSEITLFDGTGVGLQDLAVASRVVELAVAQGLATEVAF